MVAADDFNVISWDKYPPPAKSLFAASFDRDENHLVFGGHARTVFESYRNQNFGFAPVPDDSWIHHRVQASAILNHSDYLRLCAELTWGEMQGKSGPLGQPDEDRPDFLQIYAQTRHSLTADQELYIRAGRQVLFYGSGRLLAHREGANQRLVHDALRVSWKQNPWQWDGLVASPVRIERGAFDNESHYDQNLLWGIYGTGESPIGVGHNIDIYYLGLDRDSSPLFKGQDEQRHTLGTRWFGKADGWNYNHEFMIQFGKVAGRDIFAGAVSLGAGHTFEHLPLKPTVGMRADLISGGQSDKHVNTFDPLFQANNYFNEGGLVSPSNLYNLNPRLELIIVENLTLNFGVNFLWRFDTDDSVYAPPFNVVAGAAPDGQSYLGTAYNLTLSWKPHPATDFSLGLTHHNAGNSLTSVGGQSVDYMQVSARIEF